MGFDSNSKKSRNYFNEALSDFTYDAASGRAIRHLTDIGYTTAQIMQEIDYPTPFAKVQYTVTRYLKETGILLEKLPIPPERLHPVLLDRMPLEKLYSLFAQRISQEKEENCYISCPFGSLYSQTDKKLTHALSMLTAREREYLEGIAWEPKIMYHRLNRRMLEIGIQLAIYTNKICFYFLKSQDVISIL